MTEWSFFFSGLWWMGFTISERLSWFWLF